jgi:hypothetical protein
MLAEAAARACAALYDMPADPGTAHQDPWPMTRFIAAVGELIDAGPDDDGSAPDARSALWTALAQVASNTLSAQNVPADSDRPVCVGELGALAALRMTWLRLVPLPPLAMSALVRRLQVLRTAFMEEAYTPALLDTVEELECAVARMLYESGTRTLFDLDPPLCRRVRADDDTEWTAGAEFVRLAWPPLVGFHRRLLHTRCLLPENDDAPVVDEAACARLRLWLLRRAEQTVYRDPSPSLLRLLVRAHMRPGDRELYRLQHPAVTTSDAGIVAASLGDTRMSDINRRAGLSPSACIRAQLPAAPPTESLELGLCIHDFLGMVTQGIPGGAWAEYYSQTELELDADRMQRLTIDYPMVVQVFNHWQLADNGVLSWYNCAVAAIAEWLRCLDMRGEHSLSPEWRAAYHAPLYRSLIAYVVHGREPGGST